MKNIMMGMANPLAFSKDSYLAFSQIYKDAQKLKEYNIENIMQYYNKLQTKYYRMLNNGEVNITLNSRHDYLTPNAHTEQLLVVEKFKELKNHKIAEILGIKSIVEHPGSTYPQKVKITLNKNTLLRLKAEAPGIGKEYEVFLEKKKASLKRKIRILDNISSTISTLNQAIYKSKKSAVDYMANNLNDRLSDYISYYQRGRPLLIQDKAMVKEKGLFVFNEEKSHIPRVASIPEKEMNKYPQKEQEKYRLLQKKLINRIERAEQRNERIIRVLEKIDDYVRSMSAAVHRSRPKP